MPDPNSEPDLIISVVAHGSDEYRQAVQLRQRVLRDPLGLKFEPPQLEAEHDRTHIVCFADHAAIGSVGIVWQGDTARFVQMAVDPVWQGHGIGQLLLINAECIAKARGAMTAELHSREEAIGFYEKCGYRIVSEQYLEVGIPHRTMARRLAPT